MERFSTAHGLDRIRIGAHMMSSPSWQSSDRHCRDLWVAWMVVGVGMVVMVLRTVVVVVEGDGVVVLVGLNDDDCGRLVVDMVVLEVGRDVVLCSLL